MKERKKEESQRNQVIAEIIASDEK